MKAEVGCKTIVFLSSSYFVIQHSLLDIRYSIRVNTTILLHFSEAIVRGRLQRC